MQKPTPGQLEEGREKTVPDIIAPGLKVLFCGINPGLYSAATGHHFARPGNRFWKALYASGFTPRQFSPREENELLGLGLGLTNLVERATLNAAELGRNEYVRGGEALEHKVKKNRPAWVAFVGIGAYRAAFNRSGAETGMQPERISGARVWLLPSASGLNAHYKPGELARQFTALRETVESTSGSVR